MTTEKDLIPTAPEPATMTAAPALSSAARSLAGAALSENTIRAYRRSLAALDAWLIDESRGKDDAAIADYIAARHEAGDSPATIGQIVAAVKCAARMTGEPCAAGAETARVLAGIRRTGRDRGRGQVQGINWSQADTVAAVAANGGGSLAGLRDAALVALASDALLRISEVVAVDVAHIAREDDGSGRLTVHRSKTDQDGKGSVLYLGAATMGRIDDWLTGAGIVEGPVFVRVRRGDNPQPGHRMADRSAREVIRKRAAAADIKGRVSGHSLRVGSAQSLAAAGAGLVELQQAGRWQSPSMPAHYARGQLAARGAVARLRHNNG